MCVTNGFQGLLVLDVSNPGMPSLMGSLPLPDFARGVAVHSNVAYVADGVGLEVIDLTDPAAPAVVGSETTPGTALRVALAGPLACVAAGESGLQLIDVLDPAKPALVGGADTPGFASAAAVAPGSAPASGALICVADGEGGLQLVDVTDPASPVIAGSIPTGFPALGVATDGRYAFVATVLAVKHNFAGRLEVIDIEDPASPVAIGSLNLPGGATSVMIAGPFAYVVNPTSGLLVVDISEPATPRLIGGAATLAGASSVTIGGAHAFVVDQRGVHAMNVQCNDPQPVALSDLEAIPIQAGGGIQIRWRALEGAFLAFEVRRAAGHDLAGQDIHGGAYRTIGWLPADTPPPNGWWSFLDRDIAQGQHYAYLIAGLYPSGSEEILGPAFATAAPASPAAIAWPNPTSSGTTFQLNLEQAGPVELQVFEAGGRFVHRFLSGPLPSGPHALPWDGNGERGGRLASGTYLVRVRWPGGSSTGRVTLIR